jgi:type IV pilus assembly protein PilA
MEILNPSRKKGFTLVETMIGVTIIGILATLGFPAFQKARQTSVASRLAIDYRVYASAFEIYATENGHWPADVNRGVVPAEMVGYLSGFEEPAYGDALWDWDYQSTGVKAGVSLKGGNLDKATYAKIDKLIDDGDLSSGHFRSNSSGATYILAF